MINITDEKLYSLCKIYGAQALEERRKFLGLLPEVNRRDLAEKRTGRSWLVRRGFSSIFEFAFKMAGASEKQVRKVLNLEINFKDKPALYHALTTGAISVNKLARISVIATPENESDLTEMAKNLPQKALEVFVKEERAARAEAQTAHPATNINELQKPLFGDERLRAQTSETNGTRETDELANDTVELSKEVNQKLRALKEKGIDLDALLLDFLEKREIEIAQTKERIGKEIPAAVSRHIPAKVIRIIRREYGKKCSIQGCAHEAKTIHHTARFAVSRSHDPRFMAPLCREHHLLAHSADMQFWRKYAECGRNAG